ncbi:nuclear protein localization 4 [Cavenderia fasciculata]|uniref:Nuclear protein localization 4 n=1 Tax=Cavenderia fasciculata TaxID=261658 RepID=F4PR75_CACFS|nr:nuclear protein localization 4 [Cavenderia fasciculata]EGG21275.1 nuclear protein localization 4 [Cavenderia fasciculata]|eukprot:XP_004359125.1 nuclear protein localization 4 [Cavenderia fasciculata]
MIIAVRTPSGTSKLDLNDTSIIKDVLSKLKALNVNIEGAFLASSPRGQPFKIESSLQNAGIRTGDLIYLLAGESPTETRRKQEEAKKEEEEENKGPLTSSCKHAATDRCVFCSDAKGEQKCVHPENATCVNCQDKKFSGKKLKWLCNHPKGSKCSNCLRVGKTVAHKCNHGPQAVCVNCMGKKDETSTNSSPSSTPGTSSPKIDPNNNNNNNNETSKSTFANRTKEESKLRCLHGPNAKCTNCLPKDDPNATEPPKRRCKNHGPNGSCIDCIEWREGLKMKLKAQDIAHAPGVAINFESANVFQQYISNKKFEEQRCGFLYGNYLDDGSVVVECIYEPPQKGNKTNFTLLEDKFIDKVESMASMLGLTRVGWIFSHPSRKYIMSSTDIIQAASFQNKYGKSFVTLILTINSEGKSNLEAFQVSDQALKLEKTGEFLANQEDPTKCKLKSPVFVEGSETNLADINFFIANVPVKAREDKPFLHTTFPVNNRIPETSNSDLVSYKIDNQDQSKLYFFSDFHFLIFLLINNIFDLKTDFPPICENIKSKTTTHLASYYDLIDAIVSQFIGYDH